MYFRYHHPFAELAKERISAILPKIQNPAQREKAKELIQRKVNKEILIKEYHRIEEVDIYPD